MVLNREEGLDFEVSVDEVQLEHVSEFKYLRGVLDESGTDEAEYSRKVASGKRVQVPLDLELMLGILNLSVLESYTKYCLYLFLGMAVRQCYGRKDLKLRLYRWTTTEVC